MFRRKKDEKVDISSLNEILVIGSKLTRIVYIAVIVAVVLLGIYVLRELKILAFLKELFVVISPIFIGLLIAWLCDPIVRFLQRKKIPRFVACILVYLVLLGLIFLLFLRLSAQYILLFLSAQAESSGYCRPICNL